MKQLLALVLFLLTIAMSADYKPFNFDNVAADSALQQNQYDYMLQYKLYGRDYMDIGIRVRIPDKSGWNGSSGRITSKEQLVLGGPILTDSTITFGNEAQVITGPVRADSFYTGNDNGNAIFAGNYCLNKELGNPTQTLQGLNRGNGKFSCDSVPNAPTGMTMPTITFPDTAKMNINVPDRGKVFIDIPDVPSYDLYVNSIRTGTEDTLYFRFANRGTLTRVFVKDEIVLGNHTVLQTYYADSAISQDKYRGNLLFYTEKDFRLTNSDNGQGALQGTFISTQKIYFRSNIQFAGQLLANQLELGDDFDGKNFHFVKFDPDTIDVKLDKYGGLKENDSTVVIPIELSDTASVAVYFTYCFYLKDGISINDFNTPPSFPICNLNKREAVIPRGSIVPETPIKINVKIDTLDEPNEFLVMHIDSLSGAILPNGETSGDLSMKIIDATKSGFDLTYKYKVEENYTGLIDYFHLVKCLNCKVSLDSAYEGRYEIKENTAGNTELYLLEPFDYEKIQSDTIKVTAYNDSGFTQTVKLPINVIDVNEIPITRDTVFYVLENSPIDSVLGTLWYYDEDINPEYNTVIFKDYSTPKCEYFSIDEYSGTVITNKKFDYESDEHEFEALFLVQDIRIRKDLAAASHVKFVIVDVDETPEVKGGAYTIKENEVDTVGKVTANDPENKKLTYKITNEVPFKIDSNGVIVNTRKFDYEKETSFVIKVDVTDGTYVVPAVVNVSVSDVNEPVHAKDTTFNVVEHKKGDIGKITAYDEDGKPVQFTVLDTTKYSIDKTGNLYLKTPYDYNETKTDTVNVIAADGTFSDTARVVVNVINVNDKPVLQPNDSLKVPENCKCTVGKVTAVDPDNDKLTYTIKESGFTIDSNGVIKTTKNLDYEKTPEVTITVMVKDPEGASDSAQYIIKVVDVNEPVHTKDTVCTVKENYIGNVCKITGTDEDDKQPTFIVTDTTNYKIDSTGQLIIKKPIDYEKKSKDTVKVIVTDGEFSDTAEVVIRVLDEPETTQIISIDDKPKQDTIRTNEPDHEIEYKTCEGIICKYDSLPVVTHRDTTVRVCNAKKTSCDSVVILFNDAPPVVILSNAKSTDAYIDYITIEEHKDDKIYVNKKENEVKVIVKDTLHKSEQKFNINVKLDTVPTKDIKIKDYNYLIDESLAKVTPIGNGFSEVKEVITDGDTKITVSRIIDKKGKPVDTTQTVTYTRKVNGKAITVSYQIDDLTGTRVSDYNISYNIDSCTTVSYKVNDKKQIVKNKEGNIAYNIAYDYVDDYGNKSNASVEIVFDNIPPKVEILEPINMEKFHTNAVNVKWTVNGEVQDTLTMQRLEKGVNYVIRRYVDKAGNVAADTAMVLMKEAKDINIELVKPVTEIDQEKVDEYYKKNKYDKKKPYNVTFVSSEDTLPETIGVGFKVDVVLPSVSPTGSVASLDDIVRNGQIPVDDKGEVVGASNLSIPVEQYVEEHCTDEFKKDFKKNGLNIPLYDVTYSLHLWVYTNNANYVNDFTVEFTLNDEAKATDAGTVQMVIDWLTDKDGNVKAKNGHSLGTGAYITNLISKSVAKHRCDYRNDKKGSKTVKKDETMKLFGYKRLTK